MDVWWARMFCIRFYVILCDHHISSLIRSTGYKRQHFTMWESMRCDATIIPCSMLNVQYYYYWMYEKRSSVDTSTYYTLYPKSGPPTPDECCNDFKRICKALWNDQPLILCNFSLSLSRSLFLLLFIFISMTMMAFHVVFITFGYRWVWFIENEIGSRLLNRMLFRTFFDLLLNYLDIQ